VPKFFLRFAAACIAMLAASPAAAYWEFGHGAVAQIAWEAMRPDTRGAVSALLAQQHLLQTPECPASTIEQASVWADCVKYDERFNYAVTWHYQNVNICKPFDLKAPCRDGHCVSAQVERNARLLADRTVPTRERVMALAFLFHLAGDLAQPMHAGDRGDKGGNDLKINYGRIGGRTNLHGVWDGWLPERALTTPPAGAKAWLAEVPVAERAALASVSVTEWSRQSWQAAHDFAYATVLGDPCGPIPTTRPTLTEAQVQALIAPVRRQVVTGGLRLARLLDDALGPEAKAPGQKPKRTP
jgi:hypothetical protein